MRANFMIKRSLVDVITYSLVGKYSKDKDLLIDALIEENSKLYQRNLIGFKYKGTAYVHSTVKEKLKTAFSLLKIRDDPAITELHVDLIIRMDAIVKANQNAKIDQMRCEAFLNYCVSLCKTTSELSLVFAHVNLKDEFDKAGVASFDSSDGIREITQQQKMLLNARMDSFKEFLDKLMVLRDLLGV